MSLANTISQVAINSVMDLWCCFNLSNLPPNSIFSISSVLKRCKFQKERSTNLDSTHLSRLPHTMFARAELNRLQKAFGWFLWYWLINDCKRSRIWRKLLSLHWLYVRLEQRTEDKIQVTFVTWNAFFIFIIEDRLCSCNCK